ncbi:MAG: hypothetical protein ACI4OC_03380, partial [Coriobacteriales bacterium]
MLRLGLAACLAASCAPSAALAAGSPSPDPAPAAATAAASSEAVSQGSISRQLSPTQLGVDPGPSVASNSELFATYARRTLCSSPQGLQTRAQVGAGKLAGFPLRLYSSLREAAGQVADGERSSSRILVTWEQLGIAQTKWTAAELGVDIVTGGALNEDTVWAAVEAKTGFGPGAIATAIECLMHDCPYELYWYDKTSGCGYQIERYNYTPEWFELASGGVELSFAVARDYAPGGAAGGYLLNTRKTGAASRAAASARLVVEACAGMGDYERLLAYRDAVCSAVEYNSAAAGSSYAGGYGDPWQLIYVFDGDPSTNVVCEGYSKAFQYLCGLSAWRGDVSCYTASGVMRGSAWSGPHMWNIVRIGSASYLADLTNCDGDEALGSFTSGYPRRLFLTGATSGSVDGGYAIELPEHELADGTRLRGSTVGYEYDATTKGLFGTGETSVLSLACEGYNPSAAPAGGEGGNGGASSAAGQLAPGGSFKAGGITYEVTAAGKARVAKL